ncbi:hypothetical protein [Actinoplanes sp. NBRC 103695]|uniref:poly(ethylene terephthalate) hydrolase family protein n=1 Tax=Actinoplanes sp. NBRC 103695 TaxID=3032202 RepID=UPI0024A0CCF9|nr:hypothetical protein [Actinoplanes sp. NBRC 103695]GLY99911.1 hypothetical protein Acsp02_71640 [Actinoplanes sp. NBRC 103695]
MNRRLRLGATVFALAAVVATTVMVTRGHTAEATTADAVGVFEYDLGDDVFTDPPEWDGSSEVKAVVHYPRRATGKLPVVVLLHGQQLSCHSANEDDWTWPCPAGVRPYPSYRGYDYLADALARDGFVVVSPSANGLNATMGVAPQRARLIDRHLALLPRLTAAGPLAGRLDLTRVGTMGHSVGGEGVFYQAADANRAELPRGVRIRGVVSLASPGPSGFNDVTVTKLPFAVISAECWGDGDREYFDNAKGHAGARGFFVKVAKANHNFFNTEWTTGPGPTDGDDTECPEATGRPAATQQQNFAVAYLKAFYAYALKGDTRTLPILTGARPVPGVRTEVETLP